MTTSRVTSRETKTRPRHQWIRPRSVNGRWKRAERRTQDDVVVPARSLPSFRACLARVRGIPLLEATPTCAEGGDKEARASLGYEASTSCELDGAIEIERAATRQRNPGQRDTRAPSRRWAGGRQLWAHTLSGMPLAVRSPQSAKFSYACARPPPRLVTAR
jgi:hypothetical protein